MVTELELTTLIRDDRGPAQAGHAVLHSRDELAAWFAGSQAPLPPALQDLDFAETSVIAVAGGATTGRDVEIARVEEEVGGFVGVQYRVYYTETAAPDAGLGYPQHLVAVARVRSRIVSFHKTDPISVG